MARCKGGEKVCSPKSSHTLQHHLFPVMGSSPHRSQLYWRSFFKMQGSYMLATKKKNFSPLLVPLLLFYFFSRRNNSTTARKRKKVRRKANAAKAGGSVASRRDNVRRLGRATGAYISNTLRAQSRSTATSRKVLKKRKKEAKVRLFSLFFSFCSCQTHLCENQATRRALSLSEALRFPRRRVHTTPEARKCLPVCLHSTHTHTHTRLRSGESEVPVRETRTVCFFIQSSVLVSSVEMTNKT